MNYPASLVGGIEALIRHIFVGFDQKDVSNFFSGTFPINISEAFAINIWRGI
ncbi:hypothetical protein HY04AAS1_0578 [Hydrogenobaculum sp. Y04AAS1]|uniref:hypothetical protein n=1 Tax=Hydrogenobaculum sp. (strain Y04AAS1) TaxID=380749 RepID=UPI00017BBDC1|nr:hypothetical protein HY04AAS1_0578 [Hydrogenobaculum sp. Y04AAS1]